MMRRRGTSRERTVARACLVCISAIFFAEVAAIGDSPLAPEHALKSFEVAPDLKVELVAAEPLVESPCALAFDEYGRLFVAENRGYPRTSDPPQGRIALLEDTDGDGRMDKRNAFADGLTFPNGVLPWKGGVFVTCAPDLLYFRDTDGDGRADERRVVLTGFATKGSTQLRFNTPLLGPDGWIWLASGLSGGVITNPERSDFPAVDLKSDLRFDPHSGRFEAVDGRSQYGHSFDDFGRRFICMNRVQVQHVVLPSRYLKRNPHLAFSDTVQNCPELVPNPLLRGGGGAARIFPISKNVTTADSHAGTFSAACAVTIWRGGALPDAYRGSAFSCDPTGNLVHVDKLEPRGATFAAVPMFEGREFLASRDDWFRPVALASGPDGALYICDMYRKVIEHPDYLPEEIRKRTDFESGKEMGRIWRVRTAAGPRGVESTPSREHQPIEEHQLISPNAWQRDTAFRLLREKEERGPEALSIGAAFHKAEDAATKSFVLGVIAARGYAEHSTLADALRSPYSEVRERALWLIAHERPAVGYLFQHGAIPSNDPAPGVRFACAIALGVRDDERTFLAQDSRALPALASIAAQDADDRWTRAAVLGAIAGHEREFLKELIDRKDPPSAGSIALMTELGRILAKSHPADQRLAVANEIQGIAASSSLTSRMALLSGFLSEATVPEFQETEHFREMLNRAADLAKSASADEAHRLLAVSLLGRAPAAVALAPLLSVLDTARSDELRIESVRALCHIKSEEGTAALLSRWASFTPTFREAALAGLLATPVGTRALLNAIEAQTLAPAVVDNARRTALRKHPDKTIREQAEKLFQKAGLLNASAAYESAKESLKLKPQPANGREVFKRSCAICHRLDQDGYVVGPDLFDIRNQPKESILLHIVVPEHEIAPGFAAYHLETKDGRTLSGIVASETDESIRLRQPLGLEETILRTNIAALTASPTSLMPPGLEQAMTRQELADLLAYLRGEK